MSDKIKINATLPEDIVRDLDEYAAERGMKRSEVISEAIKEYVSEVFGLEDENER